MSASKFFPVQGVEKFETVSFPVTKAVKVDFSAATTGTYTVLSIPAQSIILAAAAHFTEGYESAGSGTIKLNISGTVISTTSLSSSVASLDAWAPFYTLASGGLIDSVTVPGKVQLVVETSGAASAGKADVFVTYLELPKESLGDTDFVSVTI